MEPMHYPSDGELIRTTTPPTQGVTCVTNRTSSASTAWPAGMPSFEDSMIGAIKTFEAALRERTALLRGYHESNMAWMQLEQQYKQMQTSYHALQGDKAKLLNDYANLQKKYESLDGHCEHISNELVEALDYQLNCESFKDLFEDQRVIKESVELRLQQADHELSILKQQRVEELQIRDTLISSLAEDVKQKENELLHMHGEVKLLNQKIDEVLRGMEPSCSSQSANLQDDSSHHGQESPRGYSEPDEVEKSCNAETIRGFETKVAAVEGLFEFEKQRFDDVKRVLLAKFPELHDSFDNISQMLANDKECTSKRRKLE